MDTKTNVDNCWMKIMEKNQNTWFGVLTDFNYLLKYKNIICFDCFQRDVELNPHENELWGSMSLIVEHEKFQNLENL